MESQDRYISLGSLEQYMRQVKRTPQLTEDEEAQLLALVAQGVDVQQARDRLIEGYQPLLIGLAKRFARHSQDMELLDFIQEGNIGLLQAFEKYDGCKDASSFRSFVFAWARGAMLAALWQFEGTFRLPVQKARAIRQMQVVSTRLLSELRREPTIAEIAREMGLKERDVRELIVLQEQQVVSLHTPLDEDSDISLEDAIPDPAASTFAEDGFLTVDDVLEKLTERERVVIQLRYGFTDGRPYTPREIAELLGVTLSTVQMVDRQARTHLRRALGA
jgi:RNA polymerase sigma factor (sigma-70 family)